MFGEKKACSQANLHSFNIRWTLRLKAFTMQPSNSLDDILQHMDPSTIQGYKTFMHEVIIQGICYHNINFETLNRYLFNFNKEAYDAVCEKLFLTMTCMQLKRSSPMGIEHVRTMTSLLFHKNHVCLYS